MLKNIDNSSLEELESEIKSYLGEYKHWNYNDTEIQYLFEFSDFLEYVLEYVEEY